MDGSSRTKRLPKTDLFVADKQIAKIDFFGAPNLSGTNCFGTHEYSFFYV